MLFVDATVSVHHQAMKNLVVCATRSSIVHMLDDHKMGFIASIAY